MKFLSFFLALFLFSGCQERSRLKGQDGVKFLDKLETHLDSAHAIDWKIGLGLKQKTISKGLQVSLVIPVIEEGDSLKLYQQKKVDSWLIKVIRDRPVRGEDVMGYLYSPLVKKNVSGGGFAATQVEKVFFRVVYAAAAPSKRFEQFRCPAFGHNKKITDLEVSQEGSAPKKVVISSRRTLRAKAQKVEITPSQFGDGKSLQGEYFAQIALFNSRSRKIMSSFERIPGKAVVAKEQSILLPDCTGFDPPDRPKEKRFQFKFK